MKGSEKQIITKELLEKFKRRMEDDEKSPATVKKYMRDLEKLRSFLEGGKVNKCIAIGYKAHLEEKYSVSSANSMLASMNSFFEFAGWYDCKVKQFKVQKKVYCSQESELTREEYLKLVSAAQKLGNKRLSLLIETVCGTGIRVSESEFITVEAAKLGEADVKCKGKSRRVFIVSRLRTKLLEYAREKKIESGPIFVTKSGRPLDRSNIWRDMKALCEYADISPKKVFPHNLRHLFARTFYEDEKDIAKLADVLGHSSINTTRVYIVTSGKEHIRHMENMGLVI